MLVTLLCLITITVFSVKKIQRVRNPHTPDPPANLIDSTLTVDSTVVHLSTSSLSTATSFSIKYIGKWSITMNPSDTNWLAVSKVSGTGSTQISVKARKLNFGTVKRSAAINITTDGANAQTRQVEIIQEPYSFRLVKKIGGSDGSF